MPVAPYYPWGGYQDISTLKCPGRPLFLKRKSSPLHESDRDILSDFGALIEMHTMCGMIKSFDGRRGAFKDCDCPVHSSKCSKKMQAVVPIFPEYQD
jgi:hypothetical protein